MAENQKSSNKQPEPVHQPGTNKGEERTKEERKEAGRHESGTTGQAQRPAGKSTGRDSSASGASDPIDPQSPTLPTP